MVMNAMLACRLPYLLKIVVILLASACIVSGLPYGAYPEDRDDHFTFQNFKEFVLSGFAHIHDGSEDCREDEVPEPSASDTIAIAGSDGGPHEVQKGDVESSDGSEHRQNFTPGDLDQNQNEEIVQAGTNVEETSVVDHRDEPIESLDIPHEHPGGEPIEPLGIPHEHDEGEVADVIRIQDSPQDGIMMRQNDENGVKDVMVREEI